MLAIVLKLLVVFLVVMALVAKKQPIYVAVTAGAVATWVLYGISVTATQIGCFLATRAITTIKTTSNFKTIANII